MSMLSIPQCTIPPPIDLERFGGGRPAHPTQRQALLDDFLTAGAPLQPHVRLSPSLDDNQEWADVLVPQDPAVARAIAFVRNNISQVFGVEALLREAQVPRRSLELTFKRCLHCTPYEFITTMRVNRAKELLRSRPRLSLTQIAAACGFADLRRLRLVFRRTQGMTPAEYRARSGVGHEALACG